MSTGTESTELRLIEGSGSPSGRYAVAWGVPGVAHLKPRGAPDFPQDRVRNYLVEKRGMRVLCPVPLHNRYCPFGAGLYWVGPNNSRAHFQYKEGGVFIEGSSNRAVTTYWDASEEWGILYYEGPWWFDAMYLCHRTRTGVAIVEIGDVVEDHVRAHLRKRHRAVYDAAHIYDPRDPAVIAEAITVRPPYLVMGVGAHVVKKDTPLDFYATLHLRIQTHAHGFGVVPGRMQVFPQAVAREKYSINN